MIRRILLLLLLLATLGGCSSGGGEARTDPTARPTGSTSSRSIKVLQSLPGRLLYVRDNRIWVHQGDDARPLQIEGPARDPAWSSDSRRIAYIQRDESFSDLYILDLASGKTTQVTFNGRADAERRTRPYVHQVIWAAKPAWSPEDDEIIFLSQEQGATTEDAQPPIYEYPLSLYRFPTALFGAREPRNSDMLQVEQQNSDILSPAWSPDGRSLAFLNIGDESTDVFVVNFTDESSRLTPGEPVAATEGAHIDATAGLSWAR